MSEVAEKYTFWPSDDPRKIAKCLKKNGAVVVQLFDFDNDAAAAFRDKWIDSRRNSPELKPEEQGKHDVLVLGKFGADGHPSSYHNLKTRKLRSYVHEAVSPALAFYPDKKELWYVHELFDRSRFQPKKTKITDKESHHRDDCSERRDKYGDVILGGWINMSKDEHAVQRFVFLEGTHLDDPSGEGFNKCTNLDEKFIKKKTRVIEVKPGALILFHQHCIHEVATGTLNADSWRLHLGFCLSKSKDPLFKDQAKWMDELAVPRIPSGQIPSMHSANHQSFSRLRAQLPPFAQMWNPHVVKELEVKSGDNKGDKYETVGWGKGRSFPMSLKELEAKDPSVKRTRGYHEEERSVMLPMSTRNIRVAHRKKEKQEGSSPKRRKTKE